MSKLNTVNDQRLFTHNIKRFVKSYEQITLIEMEKIREEVVKTRGFMDGLQDIFTDVRHSYRRYFEELKAKAKDEASVPTIPHNGKEAVVLLSASTKFSQTLNRKVFSEFKTEFSSFRGDVFIYGKTGQKFFAEHYPNQPYELIEKMIDTAKKLANYKQAIIYYPRFENVARQNSVHLDLSGEESFLNPNRYEDKTEAEKRAFLFEPDLEEILTFFQTQVAASLLSQAIQDTELAHLGTRLTTLESVVQTVEDQSKKIELLHRRLKKQLQNRKQRQRLAGMSLWS